MLNNDKIAPIAKLEIFTVSALVITLPLYKSLTAFFVAL